jgi:hypothetical protein
MKVRRKYRRNDENNKDKIDELNKDWYEGIYRLMKWPMKCRINWRIEWRIQSWIKSGSTNKIIHLKTIQWEKYNAIYME